MNRPFFKKAVCIGLTTFADLYQHIFNIVVDRGIEPLCQDWESCILTIRWIDQRCNLELRLRKVGDSNPRYGKPARQFSKLVVSATHPTFQSDIVAKSTSIVLKCGCKDTIFFLFHQIFLQFFSRKVHFFLFFLLFGDDYRKQAAFVNKKRGRFTNYWKSASCRKGPLDDVMKLRMS